MGYGADRVRNVNEALAYITNCNLATVCDMASKKSRPKLEFARQISIAQSAVDLMVRLGVDFSGTRAQEVCDKYSGSVERWAAQWTAS